MDAVRRTLARHNGYDRWHLHGSETTVTIRFICIYAYHGAWFFVFVLGVRPVGTKECRWGSRLLFHCGRGSILKRGIGRRSYKHCVTLGIVTRLTGLLG